MTAAPQAPSAGARPGKVTAVLGPTNTGKTHLAIERLVAYRSAIMGFPLRLLARENYDKVAARLGAGRVALITGEEKIVPDGATHFLCTTESMPLDRPVDFVALDEIQLCADPERGHIFTERLLHARGINETMVLGSDTVRPLLHRLLPQVEIIERPRLSHLTHAGRAKLARLPRRSAVVAFSASDVYAHAEYLRRTRGGTAVVLGALSPRTRNAQVEMYQAGEVDYLVATDAIGMGLNMDIDHVAFARLNKFDGRRARRLTPPEIGQIAGRAGRHVRDGTFGTTGDCESLAPGTVDQVTGHAYPALQQAMWRNSQLDFRSVGFLLKSLEQAPPVDCLKRPRTADDHNALAALADDPEVAELAKGEGNVRLLWDVCQVPDFRRQLAGQHSRLLKQIFLALRQSGREQPCLSEDWVAAQIRALDAPEGDIDQLAQRIAGIRTWTYIAHRGDWLPNARYWQEASRAVEDRLSDALHDRLTQRFVDRRAAVLMQSMAEGGPLMAGIKGDGQVLVEGEHVGRLSGFRFALDTGIEAQHSRAVQRATRRALGDEIRGRLSRLEAAGDDAFGLADDGTVTWQGEAVGRLTAGASLLSPDVAAVDSDLVDAAARERIARRLRPWLAGLVEARLRPLANLKAAELTGPARGLAFQVAENLGVLARRDAAIGLADGVLAALGADDIAALERLGLVFGREHLYVPALLKPGPAAFKALLWTVHADAPRPADGLPGGRVATPAARGPDKRLAELLGYATLRLGGTDRLVRVDMLERLHRTAQAAQDQGVVMPDSAWAGMVGGGGLQAVIQALQAQGWKRDRLADGTLVLRPAGKGKRRKRGKAPARRPVDSDSPFAVLAELAS